MLKIKYVVLFEMAWRSEQTINTIQETQTILKDA